MRQIWTSREAKGRISIELAAFAIGDDLLVSIAGGKCHIGCVDISFPHTPIQTICGKTHKDYLANEIVIKTIKKFCPGTVVVAGGIHFDAITSGEITDCLELCREQSQKLADFLKTRQPLKKALPKTAQRRSQMLTVSEIDEFLEQVRSGQFEKEFREGGKFKKEEMLELLEKIMDAADMADEIATKLIYRGLPVISPKDER